MPNKCSFLRTPFRTLPSVIAHSGFSCKQILLSTEPVGDEAADGFACLLGRPGSNTELWLNMNVKCTPRTRPREKPWCPQLTSTSSKEESMANNEIFCKGSASISVGSRCSAGPSLSLSGICVCSALLMDGWKGRCLHRNRLVSQGRNILKVEPARSEKHRIQERNMGSTWVGHCK